MRNRMRKKKAGRPRSAAPRRQLALRLDPLLFGALSEAVIRSRRTTSEEIRIAIEGHLQRLGLWPAPARGNGQPESHDIS